MGYYINPPNESKENFLNREAVEFDHIKWEDIPKNCLPVALIDNGLFTAAGIGYCEQEWQEFSSIDDRPTRFYIVEKNKLRNVSDLPEKYLLKDH